MGKITNFIINKSTKINKIYSVMAFVLLIVYLLANFSLYNSALKFADKYDADIVIEYDPEPDYKSYFAAADEFSLPIGIEYSPSYFKFYEDGEDIVEKYELYFEYQDFNYFNKNFVESFDLLVTINLIIAGIGLLGVMFGRQFSHPYIAGFTIFIVSVVTNLAVYLEPMGVLLMLTLLLLNIYFAKKNRFCDYNESRLTAIFK